MRITDKAKGGTAIWGVMRFDNHSYDDCIAETIEEMAKKFHVDSNRLDWSSFNWGSKVIKTDQPVQKALELVTDIPEIYLPLIVAEAKLKVDKAFNEDFRPYDTYKKKGNIWVNTGRDEIMKLATGTGSPQAFNNATADLGVGNTATAPAKTQTALLGTTLYKAMNGGYPTTPSTQAFDAQATFGDAEAKFSWLEEAFRNGSSAAVLWNRANTSLGDKTSVTETWILTMTMDWTT